MPPKTRAPLQRFDLPALRARAAASREPWAAECAAALAALETDGFYVLRGVVGAAECDAMRAQLVAFMRATGSNFSPDDAATWGSAHKPVMHRNTLLQSYGVGQCAGMWAARTHPNVLEVWRHLCGVATIDDLVTSFDGFAFGSADDARVRRACAEWDPRSWPHVARTPKRLGPDAPADLVDAWQPNWAHIDQATFADGPQPGPVAIQSSLALLDADADAGDACFMCVPHSHNWIHAHADALVSPGRTWGRLSEHGFARLLRDASPVTLPMRVGVRKGDVIVWRSDLVHYSCPALRVGLRCAAFIAMCPRAWLSPTELKRRYMQFRAGKSSGAIAQIGTGPFPDNPQPRYAMGRIVACHKPTDALYYETCASSALGAVAHADDDDAFVPLRVRLLAGWCSRGAYVVTEHMHDAMRVRRAQLAASRSRS